MADDDQSNNIDLDEEEEEEVEEEPPEDAQSTTSQQAEAEAEPPQAAEASVKDAEPSQVSVKEAEPEPSEVSVKEPEVSPQPSVKDAEPSQASMKDAEPEESQASVKDAEPSQASVKDAEPSQASVKSGEGSQAAKSRGSVKSGEGSQAAKSRGSVKSGEGSQAAKSQGSIKDAEGSQVAKSQASVKSGEGSQAAESQASVKEVEGSQAAGSQGSAKDAEGSQAAKSQASVKSGEGSRAAGSQGSVKDAEGSQAAKSQASVRSGEGSQAAGSQGSVKAEDGKSNMSGSMAKEQSQSSVKPSEKSQSSIAKGEEELDEPPALSSPEGEDGSTAGREGGSAPDGEGGSAPGGEGGGAAGGGAEGNEGRDAEGSQAGEQEPEPEPEPEPRYVEPLGEATEEELSKNEINPFILDKLFHEGSMGRFDHSDREVEKIQMGEGGSSQYEDHEWQLEKMYRKVPEDMFMGKVNPKPEVLKYEEEKFILGKLFRDLQEEDYGYLPTAEAQESKLDLCDALEVNQFPQEPAPCRPPPMPEPEEEVENLCGAAAVTSSTGKVFQFSYGGNMAVSVESTMKEEGDNANCGLEPAVNTQQQSIAPLKQPLMQLGDPCEESIAVTTVASVVQSKGDACNQGRGQCKNKLKCDSNVKAVCDAARTAMAIYDTVTGCDNYPCNEGDRPEKEMENIEDGVWPWLYQLIFKLTPVDNNDNQLSSMNDDPSMDSPSYDYDM